MNRKFKIIAVLFFSLCYFAKGQKFENKEYQKALAFFENQVYDSAQFCLEKLIPSLIKDTNYKAVYYAYDLLGNTSYIQSDYSNSLRYYIEAQKISLKLSDCDFSIKSQLNIVRVSYYLGEKPEALASLRKIRNELNTCPDDTLKHDMLYKFGAIYLEIGEPDSAQISLEASLSCCENWLSDKKKAQIFAIIGENYWLGLKDNQKAYSSFLKAKKYADASKDLNSRAFANIKLGGFTESDLGLIEREALLDTAYMLFDSLGSIVDLIYVKRMQANLYQEYGLANKLYNAYNSVWPLYDTLHRFEMRHEVADLRTKYRTQQKEEDNIRLNLENARQELALNIESQKNQKLVIGLVISILLGSGLLLFLFYRNKIKAQKLQSEQERKTFLAITEGEEKERIRLSKELHDGLGQILSTARMNVNALDGELEEEDVEIWQTSLKLIDEAVVEVRNVSHALMPSALVQLGLIPAISQICDQINAAGKIKVEFSENGDFRNWPDSMKISVFRIVQEVLNNMVKHAEASAIRVSLKFNEPYLQLNIEDNGKGFDLDKIETSKGIGWKNIKSRVNLLRGELEIDSEIGKGTSIALKLKNEG